MKIYKYYVIYFFKRLLTNAVCLTFTFALPLKSYSQAYKPSRTYIIDNNYNSDSLFKALGNKKKLPEEYEKQCLIALSYYPELENKKIIFKYRNIRTTMNCRPKLTSVFKKQRVYNICINKKKDFKGIILKDVPFNAQIGIIGHELAHITDYENKSSFEIIDTGIKYLIKKKKKQYEQKIDQMTINKGLGWQLYDWANFSMYESDKATESYKEFKRRTYLQPILIEASINNKN